MERKREWRVGEQLPFKFWFFFGFGAEKVHANAPPENTHTRIDVARTLTIFLWLQSEYLEDGENKKEGSSADTCNWFRKVQAEPRAYKVSTRGGCKTGQGQHDE